MYEGINRLTCGTDPIPLIRKSLQDVQYLLQTWLKLQDVQYLLQTWLMSGTWRTRYRALEGRARQISQSFFTSLSILGVLTTTQKVT